MSTNEQEIIDDMSILVAFLSVQYDSISRAPGIPHSKEDECNILEELVVYVLFSSLVSS